MKVSMMLLMLIALTFTCMSLGYQVLAQQETLAARPPMGWNSWNHFKAKVDDATIRAQAEAMVSSGMRDAGYT